MLGDVGVETEIVPGELPMLVEPILDVTGIPVAMEPLVSKGLVAAPVNGAVVKTELNVGA